jgi:hypothetical protein
MAALDEEERVAERINHAGHWTLTMNGPDVGIDGEAKMVEHVIRHDPATVLRKVAAARKILELHAAIAIKNNDGIRVIGHECSSCFGEAQGWSESHSMLDWPCPTVLALAEMFDVTLS